MDKDYWNHFYVNKSEDMKINSPSQFAVFAYGEMSESDQIVELGMGNGRDSKFFLSCGHAVIGLDQDLAMVNKLNSLEMPNAKFFKCDLENASTDDILNFVNDTFDCEKRINVYARFFMHAINEDAEVRVLKAMKNIIHKKNGQIFLEFRSEEDQHNQKETGQHQRRYIKMDNFERQIKEIGLKVIYHVSGQGYAKYKNDDANVARYILGN